jgi:hypothetical protein
MITDCKTDAGIPLVARVFSLLPMTIGGLFIYTLEISLFVIGVTMVLICLGVLTGQSRVTVDFKNRKIRTYILIFGIKTGKWQNLLSFDRITLTDKVEGFRELNLNPVRNRIEERSMLGFTRRSVSLNLRNKSQRLTIACGRFNEMQALAFQISEYTGQQIFDFTDGKSEILYLKSSGNG